MIKKFQQLNKNYDNHNNTNSNDIKQQQTTTTKNIYNNDQKHSNNTDTLPKLPDEEWYDTRYATDICYKAVRTHIHMHHWSNPKQMRFEKDINNIMSGIHHPFYMTLNS